MQELAALMEGASLRLAPIHGQALRLIERSPWEGPSAEEYERQWRDSKARLDAAAKILDAASASLRRNSAAQLRTSAAEGGDITGGSAGRPGSTGGEEPLFPTTGVPLIDNMVDRIEENLPPEVRWAFREGREQLKAILESSPEAQLAWWNSLTPAQQHAMLAANPALLLMMAGLPADARSKANRAVIETLKDDIATLTAEIHVEGEASIKIIKLGVEGELLVERFADGHYEVTVMAGGDVGVGLSSDNADGSVTLHGEVAATYEFDSQAEADAFINGLFTAPKPDDRGDIFQMLLPGQQAAYTADEVLEYLRNHSADHKTTTIAGELSGDVSVTMPNAGKIELDGGIGLEYDTATGSKTAYIEVSGDAQGQMGPWAGAVAGDARVALTFGPDNAVSELTLSGSFSAQAGVGVISSGADAFIGAGAEGTFEVKVDLSSAANQQLAAEFVRATTSGDASGAANALAELREVSQVIVQTNGIQTSQMNLDAKLISGGVSTVASANVGTWVKPAHGDFAKM